MNKRISLRRKEALTGLAYAALPLAGFAVFYVLPFGLTIQKTFLSDIGGIFVGFSNYISVINSSAFRMSAGNTFKFIGAGVPLLILLSFIISLMLNTRLKGSNFFRSAYILPLVLPAASVILVFQVLFENGGVTNYILDKLGMDTVNFLRSGSVFWVLILLYIWKNAGYCIVLMLSGLSAIPKEYYEAARVDGAGTLRQTIGITLPLMIPTFFFTMIISIVNSFKAFREAYALAGNHPDESIYMLQHFMNNNFANLSYSRLSVSAVLTFIVIFMFVFAMFVLRGKAGDNEL